ncbi:centrosomal protein of 290 kDa-like [Mya arenaria]|uniref:centrosomal protein of 290 kDa-like n=1 Tax=Mya arenaria TaxID=6604 RepID=UPI0022E71B5E|nr:centrosomal protein of 290 kDa-like [Mya arenaria]
MAYPDIHTCMRLTSENEELRMKLVKVKHQRDDAVSELRQLKEANKVHELLRNYVTTRDIYVQTEGRLSYPPLNRPAKKTGEENEEKKSSTLLSMHSSLMKRYEKEVKQNMTHIETITNLNLGMIELERKLKERTEEVTKLEREVKMLQIQSKSHARRRDTNRGRSPDMSGDEDDVSKIRKENRKLRKDLDRLKQEISGLDHGFFEEIEDIKFALQQSAKLNKVYEKTLRKLCMQFGVPYPNPELAIQGHS